MLSSTNYLAKNSSSRSNCWLQPIGAPLVAPDSNEYNWRIRTSVRSPRSVRRALPRLRHHIDQRRLALLHALEAALIGGGKVLGVGDRSFAVEAVGLRHFGVADIGIGELGADARVFGAAVVQAALALDKHHFGMIAAVIMHHDQHGDAVMRR